MICSKAAIVYLSSQTQGARRSLARSADGGRDLARAAADTAAGALRALRGHVPLVVEEEGLRPAHAAAGVRCPVSLSLSLCTCMRVPLTLYLSVSTADARGCVVHVYASGESVEHRVTAATREAAAGFRVCPGCEFENFRRYAFCTLCGEKLLPLLEHESPEKSAQRHDVKDKTSSTNEVAATPSTKSTLQLRVSKRKQWMRKVDVDGNMFWYRGSVGSESAGVGGGVESQQPGYVVVLARSESSSAADDNANDQLAVDTLIDDEHESLAQCQEPASEVANANADANPSSDDRESEKATRLVNPMTEGAYTINVVSVSEVDFVVPDLSLSTSAKEIVALAARDFPTKYAHFVVSSSSLIAPVEHEFIKLSVHRNFVLEESIDHVSCVDKQHMRSFMRVNFLDESGVDAGGVHREWFLQVNELLLAEQLRVFVCTNKSEQSYYLNPNSAFDIGEEEHLAYYFAAGRLIGRALLEGGVWGFHLSLPLIKIVLGIPVTFSDLEYLDPEAYRSLVWLRENDGVGSLGLDFSVTVKRGDEIITVDLIPSGHSVDVTDANKHEYLERKFHYLVFESVSGQLGMLLKGLYEVIPQELLMLFDAEEFDYLLCGTQEVDVDDWEANSKHSSNLKWNGVLAWFWEVVREMPNETRRRLLMFATGSSRVPLAGFAGLTSYDGRLCPFSLRDVPYSTTPYISSHACFNRLDIPMYRSKDELRTVLLAILDTESYGFTTV